MLAHGDLFGLCNAHACTWGTDPGKLIELRIVFQDACLVSVVSCLLVMLDDQQCDGTCMHTLCHSCMCNSTCALKQQNFQV